jgi:heme A synthase
MATLPIVHERISRALVVFVLACAMWGAWACLRQQGLSSNFRGTWLSAGLLALLQAGTGLVMAWTGRVLPRTIHGAYGLVIALTWPSVYVYARGRDERDERLAYSLASFVLVVLIWRAM